MSGHIASNFGPQNLPQMELWPMAIPEIKRTIIVLVRLGLHDLALWEGDEDHESQIRHILW